MIEFKMRKVPINELENLKVSGKAQYKLVSYGPDLARNKKEVWKNLNLLRGTWLEKRLLIAVAMQETCHMSLSERDASKDGTPSENVTLFNMNVDMVRFVGVPENVIALLNTRQGLVSGCAVALHAMRTLGVKRFLDFHRGGRTGYDDGVSYDCVGYRTAIATMLPLLIDYLTLASSDDRRIDISTPHV